ncbi:MAG: ABC transporter substrate-binding protein [Streptosporangiaceae bacterium]|nr:ABC transporter substrate-binding protein [Streptosporangiaceae bacterium]
MAMRITGFRPSEQKIVQLPRRGGTLTMVGVGDVDSLDPALAYHTVTRGILRAYTRQLVGYIAQKDPAEAGRIVPDMATEVPTIENGRLSTDGRTYVFTLKEGVYWNAPSGIRPVTARDVVRGIKRLADPRMPSPGLPYYLSTIAGMSDFRDALAEAQRTGDPISERMECLDINGVQAIGESEVRFTIQYPASDFLNMLALPFATPASAEYLALVPGSPEMIAAIVSNGPYQLRRYVPGEQITLERNPAWVPASDSLRAAHVDRITVREGLTEQEAYELVATGSADMLWDIQPPTEKLPELLATGDSRLEIYPAGLLSPYLVINFASTAAGGHAVRKRAVRMALQYAVDKAAVSAVWGGTAFNAIADQVLPSLCHAHQEVHPYQTAGGRGDPELARRLLADAGYPDGLTLRMVFRDCDIHPETAEVVGAAMARAGIRIEMMPVPIDKLFSKYFSSTGSTLHNTWDIALTGWEPDWYGNNARTYLQPLFDSRAVSQNGDWGSNFGHYRSESVNRLLEEALRSGDEIRAGELMREAEVQVLADAAVVPILFAYQYWFHSGRVQNWLPYPVLNGDLTNLWLAADDGDQRPKFRKMVQSQERNAEHGVQHDE